ncbi:sodium- and chloride-dependent glycine transporter 1-like [Plakobranchus ocellatus]|uniref:Sodium- and chloride-dependent glycine transporter 1-like n=1 Tax=Plakobranchus ocellatus TaxID=259542 RepID=A0AAV4CI67_9GAST|nr:sodium- and chloride-dependent glycine transporter 1-like [Plakobranchus ocellatus]
MWRPLFNLMYVYFCSVPRDALFVSLTGECTSIYGGFAIFTVLGHMAHIYGQPVSQFARSGPGLAFVVYPEAIAQLPLPQFWGVLFFVMLFTLGLDSQFSVMETMITDIVDLRPRLFTKWRVTLTAAIMFFVFLISIPFAARGGVYLFQLIDWYIAAYTVVVVAFLECLILGWIYGTDYFQQDLELMLGRKQPLFSILWRYITPTLLTGVFVSIIATYRPPTYEGYEYTAFGSLVGWFAASVSFIPIPVMAVHEITKTEGGTLLERIRKSLRPTRAWRPADADSRATYKRV